jgi:hypothetical protein
MPHFRFENTKPAPTSAEFIADLQRVAAEAGVSHVSQNAYRHLGAYSSTVMKTRFGSWNINTSVFDAAVSVLDDGR